MQFDAAKHTGSIDVRVPMKNLQTGSDAFTHHLKSADLFNAEKFPEMRFVSSKFHFSGNRVTAVDGQLTLLGQTHPVRFAAQKFNCYESPMLKTQAVRRRFHSHHRPNQMGHELFGGCGYDEKCNINAASGSGQAISLFV